MLVEYTAQIHRAEEGGFWAEVPALPGCFTQGESLKQITENLREAMESYLGSLAARHEPFPVEKQVSDDFAFPISVRTPKLV